MTVLLKVFSGYWILMNNVEFCGILNESLGWACSLALNCDEGIETNTFMLSSKSLSSCLLNSTVFSKGGSQTPPLQTACQTYLHFFTSLYREWNENTVYWMLPSCSSHFERMHFKLQTESFLEHQQQDFKYLLRLLNNSSHIFSMYMSIVLWMVQLI